MEAYFYVEELPLALEYGMTPKQFWEEDMDLFYAYQKAYVNRVHKQSHIQGLYANLAFQTTLSNVLAKKGDKAINYPNIDIYNPFNEKRDNEPKTSVKTNVSDKQTIDLFHIKRTIEQKPQEKEE